MLNITERPFHFAHLKSTMYNTNFEVPSRVKQNTEKESLAILCARISTVYFMYSACVPMQVTLSQGNVSLWSDETDSPDPRPFKRMSDTRIS
jgi:hypothetical protein